MSKVEQEAIKTDSSISSMRVSFFWIIKTIIVISAGTVIAKIGLAFYNPSYVFDMTGIVALVTALGVVAFGGKSIQSFGEGNSSFGGIVNKITSFMTPSNTTPQNTMSPNTPSNIKPVIREPDDNR